MFETEIAKESLERLAALRRAHLAAAQQLITSGDTAVTRMVAFVATELSQAWELRAPRLTGTLASATREQVFDAQGKINIDPTAVNPVFGGRPADYGPVVHSRYPWVDQVVGQDAPRILVQAGEDFFGEIDEEYRKELG